MRNVLFSLVFLGSLATATPAKAEIWECGEGFFSTTNRGPECVLLRSSKVCGLEGNKYFSPYRPGLKPVSETNCPTDEVAPSPFVNLALARSYEENPVEVEPTKQFKTPPTKIESALPADLNIETIGAVMEQLARALAH